MDLNQKLLAAFQIEHAEHLEGIRAFLAGLAEGDERAPLDVDEAYRRIHSLKGGARVCGLRPVEMLAHRLETILSEVRAAKIQFDRDVIQVVNRALDSIEDHMMAVAKHEAVDEPLDVLAALERILETELRETPQQAPAVADQVSVDVDAQELPAVAGQTAKSGAMPQSETVRISTEGLDQLLRSSGQLLAETSRQDQITREIRRLNSNVGALEGERALLRKGAAETVRRLATGSQGNRLARYFDFIEAQMRSLTEGVQRLQRLQQHGAWLMKTHCQRIHRDVLQARMVSVESVFQGFRKMVRDLASDEGKQIDFTVTGFEVLADRSVLETLKDPIMHMLCNSVIHGIERPDERRKSGKSEIGRIALKIEAHGHRLDITVDDDGRGVDWRRVSDIAARQGLSADADRQGPSNQQLAPWLFQPGFTTSKVVTEVAGRGMGLSVVHEAASRLQGESQILPKDGPGASFFVSVPLAISTHRLLLVSCREQTFAISLHGVERLLRIKMADVETAEGKPLVNYQGRLIPLVGLYQLLAAGEVGFCVGPEALSVVIVNSGVRCLAVAVDAFVAEGEFLVREFTGPAAKIGKFTEGVLLEDGSVALVIHPRELVEGLKLIPWTPTAASNAPKSKPETVTVLVVDDSFTTRTLEKSILETHGYNVRVAVDGVEALAQLAAARIDLVISDIQMPRLDGLGLLSHIKADERLKRIPVILVTSMDRREDQQRGLDLGADAYIVKRKFDHQDLLNTIRQII